MLNRRLIVLIFIIFLAPLFYLRGQNPVDLVKVSLLSDAETLKPGDSAWLLVNLDIEPGWHVYWQTSGEAGYPTNVKWEAVGAEIGVLYFPRPDYYEFMDMASYVHNGSIALLAQITLDEDWEGKEFIEIRGKLSTLVCNEANCLPYETELRLQIPVASTTRLSLNGKNQVMKAKENWPLSPPPECKLSLQATARDVNMEIQHPTLGNLNPEKFNFFPIGNFFVHGYVQNFSINKEFSTLRLSLPRQLDSETPAFLSGVLTHPDLGTGWLLRWEMNSIVYGEIGKEWAQSGLDLQISEEMEELDLEMLGVMLGIVLVAFAIWVLGKGGGPSQSKSIRNASRWSAFALFSFGFWLGFPSKNKEEPKGIQWKKWSPEIQKSLMEKGNAFYVDYTAKWCASCIGNKRVYAYDSVIELFKEKQVVALRADWTKRGSVILKSLRSYGREGVPLNVYYPASKKPGEFSRPLVLPEVLTEKIMIEVIENEQAFSLPEERDFFVIMAFAALGGLILNLMPCVFPVIGLKILSFVKQAGQDPESIKNHGLVFTLGVVLSFWLMVGILLILRQTMKEDLGWGFQLQEPTFVFVLAVFLLVFAMSLSGIFEIGNSMTGVGARLTRSGGLPSSFFSGVLATIVATPCMAPFLGVAVGAALTMESFQAYSVFTSIALGLSAPYLVLSIYPNWISRLPKPGAWMNTFKEAMAFPLYGTVAWLLWTLESLL